MPVCSNCGNPVAETSKICPVCYVRFRESKEVGCGQAWGCFLLFCIGCYAVMQCGGCLGLIPKDAPTVKSTVPVPFIKLATDTDPKQAALVKKYKLHLLNRGMDLQDVEAVLGKGTFYTSYNGRELEELYRWKQVDGNSVEVTFKKRQSERQFFDRIQILDGKGVRIYEFLY